ncbi:MAG: DUF423 domain-containing protein [Gammaproteobacteria bacterium]
MRKTSTIFITAASLLLLVGTILGAVGSHALADKLTPQQLNSWELGVQYHLVHGLGIILIATLYEQWHEPLLRWAGSLMLIGVFLFSGTIYGTKLFLPTSFGVMAPFGGLSFMLGWLLLAISALKQRS